LYNQLIPTGCQVIFGIETPNSGYCPDFILCLPYLTSLSASSIISSEIVLEYTGDYPSVNIMRDGISIATGITTSSYTDTELIGDTSYTYIVTPISLKNASGSPLSITQKTVSLPFISSLSVSNYTSSQIVLVYAGNYKNVSITRNGTPIATNITGTTYTDTGLTGNNIYIHGYTKKFVRYSRTCRNYCKKYITKCNIIKYFK
jgi:hypothetical protein